MIKVKTSYPWGERDLVYDHWTYTSRRYVKCKDEWRPDGDESTATIRNQQEYAQMMRVFADYKDDVREEFGDKAVVEFNSHYWEQMESDNRKTVYFIQGFLSDKQE